MISSNMERLAMGIVAGKKHEGIYPIFYYFLQLLTKLTGMERAISITNNVIKGYKQKQTHPRIKKTKTHKSRDTYWSNAQNLQLTSFVDSR